MKVKITSPYGTTYDMQIVPAGGTPVTVHFDRGVAVLDVDDPGADPRVQAYRGLAPRREALTYQVKVLDEPAVTA